MVVELINTGSELLLGRVLNTHQQWLCRQLADRGYGVVRQVAVPDTGPEIQGAVRESLSRADLVITTGGLGPTSDDITRELVAQLLGRRLCEDEAVLASIKARFEQRGYPMPARTRAEAMVPEGGLVLPNRQGTAPGLAICAAPNPFRAEGKPSWLIMLPGPPRELRPMFLESVVPLLQRELPPEAEFICHTWRTTGIGESAAEEKVDAALRPLMAAGLEVGYCARPGQVEVRVAARGANAARLVAEADEVVRARLGGHIFGTGDEDLESVLVRRLTDRRETLALAESCTGGAIAHRITNVPGASAVLLGGLVTYSNEAKQKFLGVRAETLAAHGAVSEAVAREMAEGARAALGATYAISVTGIAGPTGGSAEKPVGTVFIGLSGPFPTVVEHAVHAWDRETFKYVTAQRAMNLLRRRLE